MSRRAMARPLDAAEPSGWRDGVIVGAIALIVILGLVVATAMLAGGTAPGGNSTDSTLVAAGPSESAAPNADPSASAGVTANSSARRSSPANSAGAPTPPSTRSSGEPTPAATPTPTAVAGGAPTTPAQFDLQGQAIPMGFPLRRDTRYHYRDNFQDVRDGLPDEYNHARVRQDGTVVRLHDGIDIYADEGEPLVAVFSGTIIDPSTRWRPWEPSRYGNAIVIMSDEPQTAGYIALYAHAERVWVQPGSHVTRGEVLGTLGRTGNAEIQSIHPHVHFELRAPFALDWSALGQDREVDAFNPYPSLVDADPRRN